jgi:hypothetical protein
MGPPKESLEKKNIFLEKYDEIRRLDGIIQYDKKNYSIALHVLHL